MIDPAPVIYYYFARCTHCTRQHQMLARRPDEPAPTHCYQCKNPDGSPVEYDKVELLDHEETAATSLARHREHDKRVLDLERIALAQEDRLAAQEARHAALEERQALFERRFGTGAPHP